MIHFGLRFSRLRVSVTACGLMMGMLVCRVAPATDIDSPANVQGLDPQVLLNQLLGPQNPAQQWLIKGNEFYLTLEDLTGGNIPFRIQTGSAHNSLCVVGNSVGIGTGAPTAGIHLVKTAQASTAEIMARFEITDDPVGGLFIANASTSNGLFVPKITGRSASQNAALINEAIISLDVGVSPAIAYNAVKGSGGALVTRPLVVYRNNGVAKVTVAANGDVFGNSFNSTSTRTAKHDIVDLDSRKAAHAFQKLTPVEFVYSDDESREKRVGFIAEDVPELVANADRKSVPIMDVVALLTRVVKDQQQTIDDQKKINEDLVKRLVALERK